MAVPSSLSDLSTTAASNAPSGSESIGTSLDDYLRSIQAIIKQGVSKGSDITAASTISPAATSSYFAVTGNTTISGISDSWNGRIVVLKFSGTPQLTHSSGLILPGAANITCAAGDVGAFVNESTGVWRCVYFLPATGYQAYDVDTAKLDVEQTWTAQQTPKNGTLTDGATIDWDGDSNGQVVKVTLGGNRSMNAPTNINEHAIYLIRVTQDGTGSRTLSWNAAFKFAGGTVPTLTTTASAVDVFSFVGGGSNVLYCIGQTLDCK
jgi:hypothetical protein